MLVVFSLSENYLSSSSGSSVKLMKTQSWAINENKWNIKEQHVSKFRLYYWEIWPVNILWDFKCNEKPLLPMSEESNVLLNLAKGLDCKFTISNGYLKCVCVCIYEKQNKSFAKFYKQTHFVISWTWKNKNTLVIFSVIENGLCPSQLF